MPLRIVLSLALLGGLVAMLIAAIFLPVNGAGPGLAGAALGGLVVYTIVAIALTERPRHRRFAARPVPVLVDGAIGARSAGRVNSRPRAVPVERDRLAA